MNWSKKIINGYNTYESFILAVVFLILGLFLTELLSIIKKDGFTDYKSLFFIIIFIAILIFVTFSIIKLKKGYKSEEQNKIDELTQENTKLRNYFEEASEANLELKKQSISDLFNISSCFLKSIYQELGLNHKDRLSVYIHNSDKCYFSLIARYSHNTDYCKQHRQAFSDTQGVLGSVWKGDESQKKIIKLPESSDKYLEESITKYNMSKDEVESLSMKSRRFLTIFIEENQKPMGVFLIESVRKADDKHVLTSSKIENLASILHKSAPYMIDLAKMYLELQDRTDISKGNDHE